MMHTKTPLFAIKYKKKNVLGSSFELPTHFCNDSTYYTHEFGAYIQKQRCLKFNK